MNFSDRYTLADGGYLGLPVLSCDDNNGGNYIVVFMQNDCVIRLTKSTMARAVVTLAFTGGETVAINTSFSVSNTAYIPLDDVFFSNYKKTLPTVLARIYQGATMTIECYNSSDVLIGETRHALYIADVGGVAQYYDYLPFAHILPDTLRLSRYVSSQQRNALCVHMTGGAATVQLYNANGGLMDSITTATDGGAVGASVVWSANKNNRLAYVRVLDSNNNTIEQAVVDWYEGCQSDVVALMWWSSVDGGYKTRVADIRRPADRLTSTTEHSEMFTARQSKAAAAGLDVSFQNLTPRDYAYYKDIMSSGEVYAITDVKRADGHKVERVPVVVRGDFPTAQAVADTDIDFNIEFSTTESL